jgi:L-fuconolactonase
MHLDSHIHLWTLDDGEYFWMREKIAALCRDFTEDDLRGLTARCGVGGAIVVQAYHNTKETMHWLERGQHNPQIAGVVGWADPLGDTIVEDVERYRKWPKFVGLRPLPGDTFGGDWLVEPKAAEAIRTLEAMDVSVDTLQRVENLPRARAFFSRFPGLRLVLNHGGRPAVMTGETAAWRAEIEAFARDTPAAVKCSGLVERAGVEWTKESVKPYVATLLDVFGPSRVMFGTNWPVCTISSTYDLWVKTLVEILDDLGLDAEEKDDVMWRTAARHYRVDWPPSVPDGRGST